MVRTARAVLVTLLVLSGAAALAQSVEPEKPAAPSPPASIPAPTSPTPTSPGDTENGRYVFNKVADGYVRLDMRTGQVSTCTQRTVGWACQASPDDRALLEGEIARLRGENAQLKKEMLARGLPLPGSLRPESIGPEAGKGLKVPSDAELDKVMTMVEKAWRRLVEIMINVQKDQQQKDPAK
ncbi:MAG: hypothetical protein JWN71_4318 [Xanthobacteraceae bacterium]|nr:hypothetical protein [Xanthobacteraceae bacterium]